MKDYLVFLLIASIVLCSFGIWSEISSVRREVALLSASVDRLTTAESVKHLSTTKLNYSVNVMGMCTATDPGVTNIYFSIPNMDKSFVE